MLISEEEVENELLQLAEYLPTPSISKINGIVVVDESKNESGSFKCRSALSVLHRFRNKDIVTASTGNFGKSLKILSTLFNVRVIVIVPESTSIDNLKYLRELPGEVIVKGNDLNDSILEASNFGHRNHAIFVNTVSESCILGVSTLFLQLKRLGLLEKKRKMVLPIGQGTLAAAATFLKDVELIGVVPAESSAFADSFIEGTPIFSPIKDSELYSYKVSRPNAKIFDVIRKNYKDIKSIHSRELTNNEFFSGENYDLDNLVSLNYCLKHEPNAITVVSGGKFNRSVVKVIKETA